MSKKVKKKTTLKKQWTRNIMILVTALFLAFGIFFYTAVNIAVRQMLVISIDSMGKVASREMGEYNLSELLKNKNIQDEQYKKDISSLKYITEKSEGLIPNIYVIIKDENDRWVYFMDSDLENGAPIGEIYPYDDSEKDLAYETGKIQVTKIEQDFIDQKAYLTAYTPIIADGKVKAIMGFDVSANMLIALEIIFLAILLGLMAISILVVWFIVRLITRKQNKSIEILTSKMREMSELKGDLTQRIEIKDNTEIGELAEYTNKMLNAIQGILLEVNNTSTHLFTTSKYFTGAFAKTKESFETMNDSVVDMASGIEGQAVEMSKMAQQIYDMNKAIDDIAEHSQKVTDEASDTQRNANEGNLSINKMKDLLHKFGTVVNYTTGLMLQLDKQSKEINHIVAIITAISDQTNLLALNASIEAARAGEHGRGFSVVADEVRKLAVESSNSADEISKLLGNIQNGIVNATKSMTDLSERKVESDVQVEEVVKRFESITTSIQNVSSMVEEVSAATEEMAANTTLISEGMNQLESVSVENSASGEELTASIEAESKQLEDLEGQLLLLHSMSEELIQRLSSLKLK